MKTHLLRWVPIALFFLVATLNVTLHLTRAAHEPCRPTLAVSTAHLSRRGQERIRSST